MGSIFVKLALYSARYLRHNTPSSYGSTPEMLQLEMLSDESRGKAPKVLQSAGRGPDRLSRSIRNICRDGHAPGLPQDGGKLPANKEGLCF